MIAAALALAGSFAPVPLQAVARDTVEPVIVELALGRLASRTVTTYRRGDEALIPLSQLLELAEVRIDRFGADVLEATLFPGAVRLTVRPRERTARIGSTTRALEPEDVVATDAEIYVRAGIVAEWLDLRWNVSWVDLAITAIDPSGLPVARRIAREWQRRVRAMGGGATPVADRVVAGERRVWDGVVLDYSVLTPSGRPIADGAYSTGLGLDLLGGSFTAVVQTQRVPGKSRLRSDLAWYGVFPARQWLTQLRLGDGYATGPRTRNVRGLALGNSPFIRPNVLGEVAFTGELGPGWQVEAYRGGRLIAFDSVNALGRFAVDAPIQYGENPVEFVAYGPFGEVRRFRRAFRVSEDRLPARAFEYGVAVGGCRTDRCTATANVDVRYGLSTRWSARAGIDQFWRDTLPHLFHPYATVAGSPINALTVEAEAVARAVLRAGAHYEPSPRFTLAAEATRFSRTPVDPILTPPGRLDQLTLTGAYRPDPDRGATFLEASLDRIRTTTGTVTSGRLGGSVQQSELLLMPAIRWHREAFGPARAASHTSLELNAFLLPTPKLGDWFGAMTTRSQVVVESSLDPVNAAAYVSRSVGRTTRVEIGGGWSRGAGAAASLTIAADLSTLRAYATAQHSAGHTAASQFLQGSLLYDRAARTLTLAPGPSLERAGVTGRVFLDQNGNERFDRGEQALPNVRVSVGIQSRTSDASGRYRLWNVTPYEPAIVAIDSATLASPLWVPAHQAVEVRPGPNRYEVVDLAVAPGGVVEGRAVRVSDGTGLPGVTLLLERVETGASRALVTFSDGEFYAMGVKPGDYRLVIDPRSAQRLGLSAEPIRLTMPASVDGATVGGLVLRVR